MDLQRCRRGAQRSRRRLGLCPGTARDASESDRRSTRRVVVGTDEIRACGPLPQADNLCSLTIPLMKRSILSSITGLIGVAIFASCSDKKETMITTSSSSEMAAKKGAAGTSEHVETTKKKTTTTSSE